MADDPGGSAPTLASLAPLGAAVADALVVVDDAGVIRFANRTAVQLFGLPHDVLVGSEFGQPAPIGDIVEIEVVVGGEVAVVEMRSALAEFAEGTMGVATLRDVSARIRAEQKLREAGRIREQLLSVAAHELRSPVTVVAGMADTLATRWDELPEEERRHVARRIAARGADVAEIVHRVLEQGTASEWSSDASSEPVRTLVERAIEAHPDVDIRLDIDDERVWADRVQAIEIVTNLVDNAIKYGETPIRLSATTTGSWTEIRCTDAGRGVPTDDLEAIFEFGVRMADDSVGTGLGLHIVRKLTEANLGNAWAEPSGTGTAFVVRLPAVAPRLG